MKDTEMNFDLEDIIAEYNDYTLAAPTKPEPKSEPKPKPEPKPVPTPKPSPLDPEQLMKAARAEADAEAEDEPDPEPELPAAPAKQPEKKPRHEKPTRETPEEAPKEEVPPEKPKKKKKRRAAPEDEPESDTPKPAAKAAAKVTGNVPKPSLVARLGLGILSLIFAVISLACLGWTVENVHPETTTVTVSRSESTADMVTRLNTSVYNSKANALSDIAYIRKQYTIPEEAKVAPAPNKACYGTVSNDNAQEVLEVIQRARDSGLLDGQDVIFDPNVSFYYDSQIQYYLDDTILVICWKELIDGFTVSCCEVKIADASQFRRKLTDDTFGSPLRVFASELSNSVNAVVAMNADFYMFRDFGIMVYDRKLYRMDQSTYTGMYKKYNCVDTCFVSEEGDLLYTHRLEERSWEDMERFIDENKILFSISFGPVLVENRQLLECDWYPAGEINNGYSRAGIGQFDKLHYFYMSLNHSPERAARWTVNQFGREMYNRGLISAYCLDGGQTSEIVFRGQPYNYIDYGAERGVSDIIYFATAIPESEVTK